ncbi:MAG: conjugal transfer protein TraD [Alphaproteobacteria bacterium HGW-Alphaproteobacteria-13]|nr:MAG: conjugal transfer protein TraD [Alphaproteobacteria bacterium HGW-Alphaproteobacteria-13]
MPSPARTPRQGRAGARRARLSFAASNASLRRDLVGSRRALYRSTAARHRVEASKARTDTREWVVKRRERTRQLIELGGLVVKAGLVDLTDDDRAALYGAFLSIAGKLQGEERGNALALWQRKGKRAFEAEQEANGN